MPTVPNPYREGLARNRANYAPLTPLALIEWVADVYPDRLAVIDGATRQSWRELFTRSRRLASMLARHQIGDGDTVAVVLPNTAPMIEAHYGVPMSGAVLNSINVRLDATTIAFILGHCAAKLVIVDREFAEPVAQALTQLRASGAPAPLVVNVDDPRYGGAAACIGEIDYEAWIGVGDPNFAYRHPDDEWDAIALNYTSGTTGNPKGVVLHHRGAYLNAIGNIVAWNLPRHPVYLWTLPMFHCNGWCFPWTLAAVAGVNVCLRKVDAAQIFELIAAHRVSHYCGAPIVHSTLINAPPELRQPIEQRVSAMVAGASPPAAMIEGMAALGFDVTHVYGLTEVYGPASICAKHDAWASLSAAEQVRLNGRQGVRYQVQAGLTVMDPQTMREVPRDGTTIGEVMFRGNVVFKGYYRNPAATDEAFAGGWFHTGDLGVLEPDGYVKLKDRAKDIIISGGENISSIEIEDVLYKHPAVLACAVVAKPDPKWGETPLAFVELKPEHRPADQAQADALRDALIAHCRAALAGFKAPRDIRFAELPKTSTGKIQKHQLRGLVKSSSAI